MSAQSTGLNAEDVAKIPPGPGRLKALNESGLVRKWEEGDRKDGLLVLNGEISLSSSDGSLDVLFDEEIIHEWQAKRDDWKRLADFIAAKLNLSNLDLSLDAGRTYQTYQEWNSTEASLGEVKPVYEEIIEILKEALKGKKPKTFSVYWVVFCRTEAHDEKAIMGQDYDSEKLGKIPSSRRSPFYPHGAPKKEFEFSNGVQL